jgi:non-ribosomal peptide synthetase component F
VGSFHILPRDSPTSFLEVTDGEIGELYIGGPAVFNGYLGRDDLTQTVLVQHTAFGRLYRTGDLARKVDGEFMFAGRADFQVPYSVVCSGFGVISNDHSYLHFSE